MIFKVEMLAFGKEGEIREVNVPDDELTNNVEMDLEKVYYYGQNDFQPQQHPSVSKGDVVTIGEDRWLCESLGFRKLTESEYEEYTDTPRRDRHFHPLFES